MMAISTQTEALIELYTQKIEIDKKQLEQVSSAQAGYTIKTGIGTADQIKVWGPPEVIENYNDPIKKLDRKIIQLNTQITTLKSKILFWGLQAGTQGCGTTVFFETVNRDEINYRGYSYTGSNPFSPINGSLNIINAGIGTEDYVTQVSIGSYRGNISVCFSITCTDDICVGYASSIAELESQIVGIQTSRNQLIEKVNFLKNARSQYEIQNYAYEQSKVQLNNSIGISSSILSFLQNPNNDEWL